MKPLREGELALLNVAEVLIDILLASGVPPGVFKTLLDERIERDLKGYPDAIALALGLRDYTQGRAETLARIRAMIDIDPKGRA